MTGQLTIKKVGNSSAVFLPKDVLEKLQLTTGDEVNYTIDSEGIKLSPYDAEFLADMEMAEEIMREDRDVLHKLAQ